MTRPVLTIAIILAGALLVRSQAPPPTSAPSQSGASSGASQSGAPSQSGAAGGASGKTEQLQVYRNLGKAFYENPTTQQQAVEQFQKALELAPDSVRERVNYGLALLRAGKTADGITKLRKAQQQDPTRSEEHTSEL